MYIRSHANCELHLYLDRDIRPGYRTTIGTMRTVGERKTEFKLIILVSDISSVDGFCAHFFLQLLQLTLLCSLSVVKDCNKGGFA